MCWKDSSPLWELDDGRGSMVIASWMTGFASWVTHLYCSSHIRGRIQSILISVLITGRILERVNVFSSPALKQLWYFGTPNIGFLAHLFRGQVTILIEELLLCLCLILCLTSSQLEAGERP